MLKQTTGVSIKSTRGALKGNHHTNLTLILSIHLYAGGHWKPFDPSS